MDNKVELRKMIANELKILRIENNETMETLGVKSNVAPSTICKYEQGCSNMNIDKIEQIISPYGLSIIIFFERIIAKTHQKYIDINKIALY